jgi:putative PIN family toxin of toxin-antitoxin system
MIAAIFDCMIYLQAATNDRSPAFACVAFVETNLVKLYLSPPILAEVRDDLSRPKIQRKFPHLTQERVDLFLQKIAASATLVNDVSDAGVKLRDPEDLPYLNLAIGVSADYVVSRDNDLLCLMNDVAFTAVYSQLRIVDPVAFLGIVRSAQAP